MKIVYYRSSSGRSPARDYLEERYGITDGDTIKEQQSKVKHLAKIRNIIRMAADKNGKPGGDYSSDLEGYSFHELKSSEGNKEEKLRVLYFAHQGSRLVLLNAFDKPDLYEKKAKKEVERKIQGVLAETNKYYKDFLEHPDHYEEYEEG